MLAVFAAILEHGERMMRAFIASIPDGDYPFEEVIDDDGHGQELLRLRVNIAIRGDRAIVDYTGTDPQARGPVNATFGVTASATCNAFLQLADPHMPRNAGAYSRLTTIAPHGSLVNVAFPGPSVGGNTETQPKLVGMILGALAPVLPEQVMAAEGATSCNLLFGGTHPRTGEQYAHYHFEASGWGGRSERDGNSAQNHIHGNCRNTSVEIFELRFPFRVLGYELVADSGGPGRRRGGLAVRRRLEVLAPEITLSALLDRVVVPAWGLQGGKPGRCASILVRRAGDAAFRTFSEAFGTASPSKFANVALRAGDEIQLQSAGGGGYGDPRERDAALVERDIRSGYVTVEAASGAYGPRAASPDVSPEVDAA
jgi:5-oxoprolinase (ATP-hydrolysing)/N-methylhydantoinase B